MLEIRKNKVAGHFAIWLNLKQKNVWPGYPTGPTCPVSGPYFKHRVLVTTPLGNAQFLKNLDKNGSSGLE